MYSNNIQHSTCDGGIGVAGEEHVHHIGVLPLAGDQQRRVSLTRLGVYESLHVGRGRGGEDAVVQKNIESGNISAQSGVVETRVSILICPAVII